MLPLLSATSYKVARLFHLGVHITSDSFLTFSLLSKTSCDEVGGSEMAAAPL